VICRGADALPQRFLSAFSLISSSLSQTNSLWQVTERYAGLEPPCWDRLEMATRLLWCVFNLWYLPPAHPPLHMHTCVTNIIPIHKQENGCMYETLQVSTNASKAKFYTGPAPTETNLNEVNAEGKFIFLCSLVRVLSFALSWILMIRVRLFLLSVCRGIWFWVQLQGRLQGYLKRHSAQPFRRQWSTKHLEYEVQMCVQIRMWSVNTYVTRHWGSLIAANWVFFESMFLTPLAEFIPS